MYDGLTKVFASELACCGPRAHLMLPAAQEVWRDFLRDFVLDVVRRPVVAVGNSIGGYISASLAGDYPELVSGAYRFTVHAMVWCGAGNIIIHCTEVGRAHVCRKLYCDRECICSFGAQLSYRI